MVTCGDHARLDDLPAQARPRARAFEPRLLLQVPFTLPSGVLDPLTAAIFNEAWYRSAPTSSPRAMPGDDELLPPLGRYRRMEPPLRATRLRAVPVRGAARRRFDGPRRHRTPEPGAGGILLDGAQTIRPSRPRSVVVPHRGMDPRPGPAVEIARPGTAARLARRAGGRGGRPVYLAKDARLRPELLETMYPELGTWRAARDGSTRTTRSHRISPVGPADRSRRQCSTAGAR